MPCMCWYTPEKAEQKKFKELCENLVKLIKELEKEGDPENCSLNDAHELINHLYNQSLCKEKKKGLL